jgi:hypothetical protein
MSVTDLISFIYRSSLYLTYDLSKYIDSGSCDKGVNADDSIATFKFQTSDYNEDGSDILHNWSLIENLLNNLDDSLSWVHLTKSHTVIVYGTPVNDYKITHIIKIYRNKDTSIDDINYISSDEYTYDSDY